MLKAAAVVLLFSAPLQASGPSINDKSLNGLSAADISAVEIAMPAPSAPAMLKLPGDVVTKLHLMPQAYKSALLSYAKNEKEFAEFTAMWNPILQKAGFIVGEISYKADLKMAFINYTSPKGLVLRQFIADELTYDALNPTEMHNLKQEITATLEKNGMPVAVSFYLRSDIFRPTFIHYYVTSGDENRDHEKQLRIYKNGGSGDIDYAMLQDFGVNIVRRDTSFRMVYIGYQIGNQYRLAADEATAAVKLAEYKKFLAENKKEFIGSRTIKFEKPLVSGANTYNYMVDIYFYQ